jgi:hypothetical protein
MFRKKDPGPCPVDDAPHTTCTSPDYGATRIVQLPGRDGYTDPPLVVELKPPFVLVGQVLQQHLKGSAFTTAGYGQMTKRIVKEQKDKKRR